MPIKHPHVVPPAIKDRTENDQKAENAFDRYTKALKELEEALLKAKKK